jgi:ribonuclease P protein component
MIDVAVRREGAGVLRRGAEFRDAIDRGVRLSGKRMVLYVVPREQGIRVGFVTGRGLGGAVQRNRARRRLQEAWRSLSSRLEGGYDIVVAARPGVEDAKTQELTAEMEGLLVRGKVVRT